MALRGCGQWPARLSSALDVTTQMEIERLNTFSDLEAAVFQLRALLESRKPHPKVPTARALFRGQASADWELETTAERFFPGRELKLSEYNDYLARIHPAACSHTGKSWPFERFPKINETSISSLPNYELMVYSRHHGLPSPLLDWTSSLYVASYFAFRDARTDDDVAIYAYVSAPDGAKSGWVEGPTIVQLGPYALTHPRHFNQQAQYTACVMSEHDRWIYCSHELAFTGGDDTQDLLRKYVLSGFLRREVLAHLDEMNINEFTLFGTEDGLMRMLANREWYFRDV